jgi:acetyl esterase
MTTAPTASVVLEPAAEQFASATAEPPYLFDLGSEKGRETVDEVQSGEIGKPAGRHPGAERPRPQW